MEYGWKTATPKHSSSYIAPAVLARLKELNARRVMDLGCGNGALCADIAALGIDAVGFEQDAMGVQIARETHGLSFHCQSLSEDPAETGFDVAVSTEVIEHLYEPATLPRFASKALNEGGHLIVTTPYHGYAKNLAISLLDHWDTHHTVHWDGGHIKFFSRKTLTQLLERTGFRVIDFQGLGRMPYLWMSMMVIAQKL